MNFPARLAAIAALAAAMPVAHAIEFEETAQVKGVVARTEQVLRPRQECRTQYVQVPVYPQQPPRAPAGAIIGGIAGAIIGHQVGKGHGNDAATVAGAIAGSVIGDRMQGETPQQPPTMQEQAVRQCRVVDAYESVVTGYDVTYEYRGQRYTTLMSYDPGPTIPVRVTVEPLTR